MPSRIPLLFALACAVALGLIVAGIQVSPTFSRSPGDKSPLAKKPRPTGSPSTEAPVPLPTGTLADDSNQASRTWETVLSRDIPSFPAGVLASLFESPRGSRVRLDRPFGMEGTMTMNHRHADGTLSVSLELINLPGAVAYFQRDPDGTLSGHLVRNGEEWALRFQAPPGDGTVSAEKIALDHLLCARSIDGVWSGGLQPEVQAAAAASSHGLGSSRIPLLESRPGAAKVIYLDFDGETVTGSAWNALYHGGEPIVAEAFGSAGSVSDIWESVAEDYRPFQVNVTTDRSVFDATPALDRCMVILTPSKAWYGNSGGVALTKSFGTAANYMSWVFNSGTNAAAEAASHEIGHQLGLNHDGGASTHYYSGHTHPTGISWAPIMGLSYDRTISQFSKGEYAHATQTQDDLAILTRTLPFLADDHGNDPSSATSPAGVESGQFESAGIIETDTDSDVFRIELTTSGPMAFTARPRSSYTNLDLRLVLSDAAGTPLAAAEPANSFAASFSLAHADAGIYYLSVAGSGLGSASTGYTNYGSLGAYTLSGAVPAALPPARPQSLSASDGSSSEHVALTWAPASHATGYRISRASPPDFTFYTQIGEVAAPEFLDPRGTTRIVYHYRVTSFNHLGESEPSAIDSGFRQEVPAMPTHLSASDGQFSTHTRLTWCASSGASSYQIFRSDTTTTKGETRIGVAEGATTFEDRSGLAGQEYHYRVCAVNAAGSSPPSAGDPGHRTAALAAPLSLTASQGSLESSVRLDFQIVPGAESYTLYRGLSPDPREAGVLGRTATTSYHDNHAAPGATYHYFVTAEGPVGDSAPSLVALGLAGGRRPGDDAYEPNDRIEQATSLDNHPSVWLNEIAGMGVAADEDWYRLPPSPSSQRIEVILRQEAQSPPVRIHLFDASGTLLASGIATGPSQILVWEGTDPNPYHFLLVAPGPGGPAPYNLLWRAVRPGENQSRSDLSIGRNAGSQVGQFVYETRAKQQRMAHRITGAKTTKTSLSALNEGVVGAPLLAGTSRIDRALNVRCLAGGSGNVIAALKSGRFARTLPPLGSTRFDLLARVSKNRAKRKAVRPLHLTTSIEGGLPTPDTGSIHFQTKKRR